MSESNFMRRVLLAAVRPGLRLFRNNVGTARTDDGRFIRFGLCVGSSDLIGWTVREVDGAPVAVFTAIEVKGRRTRVTPQQTNFLKRVKADGGIALLIREGEDIEDAINAVINEEGE